MTRKEQAQKLLERIKQLENPVDEFKDSLIAQEISNISERLKQNPTIKTLQKFNADLTRLNTELLKVKTNSEAEDKAIRLELAPIQQSIRTLQRELKQADFNLQKEFETKLRNLPKVPDLTKELAKLRTEFNTRINAIPKDDDSALQADLDNIKQQLQDLVSASAEEEKIEREELNQAISKFRTELNNRLANIGGGQAAPQFMVANVESKKYKDINLKAGANVTLTLADNNTTHRSEITIAATGGSGSGITRSINSVSVDTTAAASATVDYVYLCSGTMVLTLPDASSNSNLYTIKNVGNGTVTVATTSSQTIDGALTQVMPVKFTSIDVISDTANWSIT